MAAEVKLVRCKPILGTIITDQVGAIEVNGKLVADFCEVDPGWFYTEDLAEKVFSGSEAKVLAHYAKGATDESS